MKISIIFHSVCGNCYLMGKAFYDSAKKLGAEVNLFRVYDEDYEKLTGMFETAKEYRDEIDSVPFYNFETLLESDILIIGSPTYFGNVSSEMKAFMDEFAVYWADAKFFGKKLFAFASAGTPEGGADMCLRSINTFGQHLGMVNIPVPSNLVPGESYPAYGIAHYSGDMSDNRPNEKLNNAIDAMCKVLVKLNSNN